MRRPLPTGGATTSQLLILVVHSRAYLDPIYEQVQEALRVPSRLWGMRQRGWKFLPCWSILGVRRCFGFDSSHLSIL
ncbi:hypothetical protein BDW75DRAFT_222253 [Aspergillus navahoensis]